MTAYCFEITGEFISRLSVKGEETLPGCLVKSHFEPVFCSLFLVHLLKDCEVKEAMAQWYIEDQKKFDEAPALEKVLNASLKQFRLLTDGQYPSNCTDRKTERSRVRYQFRKNAGISKKSKSLYTQKPARQYAGFKLFGLLLPAKSQKQKLWHLTGDCLMRVLK